MDSNNKIDMVTNRVIEQVAENMKAYGFPGTLGRVYAIIYFEGKPLDLDTLAEKTGMSKTRMSQVLRELANLNLAEKVFVKGSRKDYYYIDADYYQNFISLFASNWKAVVSRNRYTEKKNMSDLNKILHDDQISDNEREQVKRLLQETQKSLDYFNWVDRLVDFFESNEVFKHVPKTENDDG